MARLCISKQRLKEGAAILANIVRSGLVAKCFIEIALLVPLEGWRVKDTDLILSSVSSPLLILGSAVALANHRGYIKDRSRRVFEGGAKALATGAAMMKTVFLAAGVVDYLFRPEHEGEISDEAAVAILVGSQVVTVAFAGFVVYDMHRFRGDMHNTLHKLVLSAQYGVVAGGVVGQAADVLARITGDSKTFEAQPDLMFERVLATLLVSGGVLLQDRLSQLYRWITSSRPAINRGEYEEIAGESDGSVNAWWIATLSALASVTAWSAATYDSEVATAIRLVSLVVVVGLGLYAAWSSSNIEERDIALESDFGSDDENSSVDSRSFVTTGEGRL